MVEFIFLPKSGEVGRIRASSPKRSSLLYGKKAIERRIQLPELLHLTPRLCLCTTLIELMSKLLIM